MAINISARPSAATVTVAGINKPIAPNISSIPRDCHPQFWLFKWRGNHFHEIRAFRSPVSARGQKEHDRQGQTQGLMVAGEITNSRHP